MTRISVAIGNSMTWICENLFQLHALKNEVQCRVQCFLLIFINKQHISYSELITISIRKTNESFHPPASEDNPTQVECIGRV